jgi:hypothetical protein
VRSAWFWNRSAGDTVRWTLRGQDYSVPPGHAAELPAELAWYPGAVGLLLEQGPAPEDLALQEESVPHPRTPRRRFPDGVASGHPIERRELQVDEPEEAAVPGEAELPAPVALALSTRRRR